MSSHLPKNPNDELSFEEKDLREIYVAGGCFWGIDAYMKRVKGVYATESGYANGHTQNPTYEQVCTHTTGFVEAVKIKYDVTKIGLKQLLEAFTTVIDVVSITGEMDEVGDQYRSGVYYTDETDRAVSVEVIETLKKSVSGKVNVEIMPLENYYPAEDYHQDYMEKHVDASCHVKF